MTDILILPAESVIVAEEVEALTTNGISQRQPEKKSVESDGMHALCSFGWIGGAAVSARVFGTMGSRDVL